MVENTELVDTASTALEFIEGFLKPKTTLLEPSEQQVIEDKIGEAEAAMNTLHEQVPPEVKPRVKEIQDELSQMRKSAERLTSNAR